MKFYVAGRDKPHRCPSCWSVGWTYETAIGRLYMEHGWLWKFGKYLPRRCKSDGSSLWRGCGAITLTTKPF